MSSILIHYQEHTYTYKNHRAPFHPTHKPRHDGPTQTIHTKHAKTARSTTTRPTGPSPFATSAQALGTAAFGLLAVRVVRFGRYSHLHVTHGARERANVMVNGSVPHPRPPALGPVRSLCCRGGSAPLAALSATHSGAHLGAGSALSLVREECRRRANTAAGVPRTLPLARREHYAAGAPRTRPLARRAWDRWDAGSTRQRVTTRRSPLRGVSEAQGRASDRMGLRGGGRRSRARRGRWCIQCGGRRPWP